MRIAAMAIVVAFSAAALGCGERAKATPGLPDPSGKAEKDGSPCLVDIEGDEVGCDASEAAGVGEFYQFVFDSVTLPANTVEAEQLGYDFDGDNRPNNSLGHVLSALSAMVSADQDMNLPIRTAIDRGRLLVLLQVQTESLVDSLNVSGDAWLGATQDCSAESCFTDNHIFEIAADSPENTRFRGKILPEGRLDIEGEFAFNLPIQDGVSIELPLKKARIFGTIDEGKISDGRLVGLITRDDVRRKLIPGVTDLLNQLVTEKNKEVLPLFDTNDDGKIILKEVLDSPLIAAFLNGDVDVIEPKGGAHDRELTFGVGFTAVSAQIAER